MPPEMPRGRAAARPLDRGIERRLMLGITALTLSLMILTTVAILGAAWRAHRLQSDQLLTDAATVAGASIVADIERALAGGQPMGPDSLAPLLRRALAQQPHLLSVAVSDPAGRVVRQEARAAADALADATALPLRVGDGPAGSLDVVLDRDWLLVDAAGLAGRIGLLVLVCGLIGTEAIRFAVYRIIGVRLQPIRILAAKLAAHDWTERGPPGSGDEAGRLLSRLNEAIRRINERRQHLDWLAAEVAQQDREVRPQVDAIMLRLPAAWRFADGEPAAMRMPFGAATLRAQLFLAATGATLAVLAVPPAAALATPALALAFLVAMWATLRAGRSERPTACLVIGGLAAVVGGAAAWLPSVPAMLASCVAVGGGLGVLVANYRHSPWNAAGGRAVRLRRVTAGYALASGVVAGLGVGGLCTSVANGWPAPAMLSSAGMACALGLVIALTPERLGRRGAGAPA